MDELNLTLLQATGIAPGTKTFGTMALQESGFMLADMSEYLDSPLVTQALYQLCADVVTGVDPFLAARAVGLSKRRLTGILRKGAEDADLDLDTAEFAIWNAIERARALGARFVANRLIASTDYRAQMHLKEMMERELVDDGGEQEDGTPLAEVLDQRRKEVMALIPKYANEMVLHADEIEDDEDMGDGP